MSIEFISSHIPLHLRFLAGVSKGTDDIYLLVRVQITSLNICA
jgi:hypothetical protein